ncbi:MAG TPA: hypothetical protein VEH27_18955 [Methylomirabilota bacterium]|nr:hypothetical protein [Methylomirabilota bacterium]
MIDSSKLLQSIPPGLRTPLLDAHKEIVTNYAEHRWEPAELNGGKLCEIVYTILNGATSGTYPPAPSKPANMVDACRALESRPPDPNRWGDRSLRILIPRLLPYLYEIRNNRNVGHVGAEVDPNHSDASAVLASSNWILAELIRIFHKVTLSEAQNAVDAIVERKHPLVWETNGVKRVLDPAMKASDQVLVLCYSSADPLSDNELKQSVEYSTLTAFRKNILKPLHKNRLIEFDSSLKTVAITPRGSADVEKRLLAMSI